jgi:hypothetical protein
MGSKGAGSFLPWVSCVKSHEGQIGADTLVSARGKGLRTFRPFSQKVGAMQRARSVNPPVNDADASENGAAALSAFSNLLADPFQASTYSEASPSL